VRSITSLPDSLPRLPRGILKKNRIRTGSGSKNRLTFAFCKKLELEAGRQKLCLTEARAVTDSEIIFGLKPSGKSETEYEDCGAIWKETKGPGKLLVTPQLDWEFVIPIFGQG